MENTSDLLVDRKSFARNVKVSSPAIETMLTHRSVRRYTDQPVSPEIVDSILVAAQSAPTSSSQNAWSVVVVRDESKKRHLQELTGANRFINYAPVFLVFIADLSRQVVMAKDLDLPHAGLQYQEALLVATMDATLAAQNAVVAAESLGLGTCFVGGVRNSISEISAALDLPDFAYPVVGLALGYPAPDAPGGVRPRLPLNAVRHYETYDTEKSEAGIPVMEQRNREYMAQWGVEGASWVGKAAQRWSGAEALDGRAANSSRLAERGFTAK